MTAMNVPAHELACDAKPSFIVVTLTHHENQTQFSDLRLVQEEENSPANGTRKSFALCTVLSTGSNGWVDIYFF